MPGGSLPPGIFRWALGVEYAGTAYSGWQRLPGRREKTIQGAIEAALSYVANESVVLTCAGRTDAGVHATGQVVHFDTVAARHAKSWLLGVNSHLPEDIRIRWAHPVIPQFHARFSAVARTYRYLIANTAAEPALAAGKCLWIRQPLDLDAMRQAAAYCLGEHDFSSVRGSSCQAKSPVRTIHHMTISRCEDWIVVEIRGNAFLHHMVRNLMGLLLPVGKGLRSPEWVADVIARCDRTQAGKTEAPGALYLVKVDYDSEFGLPLMPKGPFMLADDLS